MTKQQAENRYRMIAALQERGFSYDEAQTLRRIEMTLQRWSEHECNGNIQRDEDDKAICTQCGNKFYGEAASGNCPKCGDIAPIRTKATNKPRWYSQYAIENQSDPKGYLIADREKGALKRLAKIMEGHPDFVSYHQGDPRGCALYIVAKSDLNGGDIHSLYTRGIAVCD